MVPSSSGSHDMTKKIIILIITMIKSVRYPQFVLSADTRYDISKTSKIFTQVFANIQRSYLY